MASVWQQQQQNDDDDQQMDRPYMSSQDIQDTGEGLEASPFTVSETFKKLDEGKAQSIFGGGATGKETVFKKVQAPQATLRGTEPANLRLCVICRGPLKGRFVKICEKGMHNECFNCAVCGENLKGRGYFEQDSKFYCRQHRP
ncbi:PDZ and LIM domain protein 4-like isoform X2 [Amphiura filiformis]|uniref:PDZ and LIM domain protein 4-like isoform X2 n=1 Tax=Amphiura filiformis TaxID=82378 RepID=UPI003B21E18D